MPMLATSSPNAFLMVPPEGGFDPPWTADLLRQFHGGGEIFALETFFSAAGLQRVVRSQSGPSQYHGTLETDSGRKESRRGGTKRCSIEREDAYVRTLHLTDHTLLPTRSHSQQQTVRSWRELADYIKAHAGGAYESRSMLRVLLHRPVMAGKPLSNSASPTRGRPRGAAWDDSYCLPAQKIVRAPPIRNWWRKKLHRLGSGARFG